jgi:hypothetical protein
MIRFHSLHAIQSHFFTPASAAALFIGTDLVYLLLLLYIPYCLLFRSGVGWEMYIEGSLFGRFHSFKLF